MTPTPSASSRAERLLAEVICRREEALGHPAAAADADELAVAAGGSFVQRIRTRALHLPGSDEARVDVQRSLSIGGMLVAALLLLSALIGAGAASAALNASAVVSLPLVLLTLVGFNLVTLMLWLILQFIGARGLSWLVALWKRIARSAPAAGSGAHAGTAVEAVRVLAEGGSGRWLTGSVVHAAWLSYTLAGLATLTILLVVRAYDLSWQTTLLSPEDLRAWAERLSFAPRLLGAQGPDTLLLTGDLTAGDRKGWAAWVLLAVLAYGVVPRLLAFFFCLTLALRAQRRWGADVSRPGLARLRTRLMPDRRELGVVDAAPEPHAAAASPASATERKLPSTPLHALGLEWPECAQLVPARPWAWFAQAEDSASRASALAHLHSAPDVDGLLILLRATATPDRGLERYVAELAQVAGARSWLVLGDADALRARGSTAFALRIADWRRLAQAAGVEGGVLEWNAVDGIAQALRDSSS